MRYTEPVRSGEITSLRDFVLLNARAYGAFVALRDTPLSEPIPEELEVSDYYVNRLADAEEALQDLKKMPWEDVLERTKEYNTDAIIRWRERQERRVIEEARYTKMLEGVLAWEPPTEEHVDLKESMIRQLRKSISWDCDSDWDTEPTTLSPEQWCAWVESAGELEVERTAKHLAEQEMLVAACNTWLKELWDSLPEPEEK